MFKTLWFTHKAHEELIRLALQAADGLETACSLFGYLVGQDYGVVTAVTGPGPGDERAYGWCVTNSETVVAAWEKHWKGCVHDLGIWHTHPTPPLTPSSLDDEGMVESLTYANQHGYNPGFSVIILVPPGGQPGGMTAWYYTLQDRCQVQTETADPGWNPVDDDGNWIETKAAGAS